MTSTPSALRPARRFAIAGVVMIFGGEAFCILGPLQYEAIVHTVCHTIFYAGIGCVAIGAILRFRRTDPPIPS